jgi:phage terminase small subunit
VKILNYRQQTFCDEYLANGGNGTKAALVAGYSERTAGAIANNLLKNIEIKTYVAEKQKELSTPRIATAQEIREYVSSVMRNDQGDIDTRDRLKAADLLAKLLGLYDKQSASSEPVTINIQPVYGKGKDDG